LWLLLALSDFLLRALGMSEPPNPCLIQAIRLLAIPITIVMGGRHNLAHQAIDHMTGAQVWVVHRTLANTTTTHRGHLLMAAQQLLNDQGLLVRRMETGGRRSGLEYMQAEARRHRLGLCARCCVG